MTRVRVAAPQPKKKLCMTVCIFYILSLHYVMECTICNMVANQQTEYF